MPSNYTTLFATPSPTTSSDRFTSALDGASKALMRNAQVPISTLDLQATLVQLPMIRHATPLPNCSLCLLHGRGPCSLLHPLPIHRTCSDTLAPYTLCILANSISSPHHPAQAHGADSPAPSMTVPIRSPKLSPASVDDAYMSTKGRRPVLHTAAYGRASSSALTCRMRHARRRLKDTLATSNTDRQDELCSSQPTSCHRKVPPPNKALLEQVGQEGERMPITQQQSWRVLQRIICMLVQCMLVQWC